MRDSSVSIARTSCSRSGHGGIGAPVVVRVSVVMVSILLSVVRHRAVDESEHAGEEWKSTLETPLN
jgi:hypothetical protein